MRSATSRFSGSGGATRPRASPTRSSVSREISPKSRPATFTASDSRRKRLPSHVRQSPPTTYRDTRFFTMALCDVAKAESTYRRALVNVPR